MSCLILRRIKNHIKAWNNQDHEVDRVMYKHALDDIMLIIDNNDPCDVLSLIKNHVTGWNIDGWEDHNIGDDLAEYQDALNGIMYIIECEEDLRVFND